MFTDLREREMSIGCLLHLPQPGINWQPRYVSDWGSNPQFLVMLQPTEPPSQGYFIILFTDGERNIDLLFYFFFPVKSFIISIWSNA